MEIKRNRYGVERVYEKIDETRIRITGESLFTRGSNDDDGVQMMFDFEGGPCFTVGGTLDYMNTKWLVKSITVDTNVRQKNLASVVCAVAIK